MVKCVNVRKEIILGQDQQLDLTPGESEKPVGGGQVAMDYESTELWEVLAHSPLPPVLVTGL